MPLVSNIHIDQALTQISQAVTNDSLIADKVWPLVNVKKDTDKYFIYNQDNLRLDDDEWASKTKANEVDWDVTTGAYAVQRRALQQLVEDDEKQNADSPIDVMADTTSMLTEKLSLRREKRLADTLSTLANFDATAQPTLGAGDQWSNFASATSDPNEDVATARSEIYGKIFRQPNLMILPYEVYEKVREHPKVTDRIKYTQMAVVTAGLLGSLWDIDNVVIAGGGENTAAEGQTPSLSYVWGKKCWLGYVTPRPSLRSPSWGYHIASQKQTVERWRDDERKGDVIRVSQKESPTLVTKSAGYIIQDVIA